MKRRKTSIGLWLVLTLVVAACGGSATTTTATPASTSVTTGAEASTTSAAPATTAAVLTPATLRLDWSWLVYHVPFLYARDKGFYEAEGIDLEILEGEGSGTTVDLVANGNDTFGFADSGTMMAKATQGAPVVNVLVIQRQSGFGTACWHDVGFTGPQDLAGRSILLIPQESTATIFPAYLELNNVDPASVTVLNADFSNKVTLLANHEADCMAGYVAQDTLLAQLISPEIDDPIPWTENGIQLMGHGIVLHKDTVANSPDLVAGFVRATIRGWEEVCADPPIGVEHFLSAFPDLESEREFSEQSLPFECAGKLDPGPGDTGQRFGPTDDAQWQAMIDLLAQYGGLENPLPPSDYYTNEFVPSG